MTKGTFIKRNIHKKNPLPYHDREGDFGLYQRLYSQSVAVKPETAYHALAGRGEI